jgi:hypothetical protein
MRNNPPTTVPVFISSRPGRRRKRTLRLHDVGVGVGDGDGDGWLLSDETQPPRFLNRTLKTAGYCCSISLHADMKMALLCPLLSKRLTHPPWLNPESAF